METERKNTRKIRWWGITQAARELGISRTHLYLVLTGARTSKNLEQSTQVRELRRRKKG